MLPQHVCRSPGPVMAGGGLCIPMKMPRASPAGPGGPLTNMLCTVCFEHQAKVNGPTCQNVFSLAMVKPNADLL